MIFFQFRKIITCFRRIGYNLNVMRHSFNPVMVDNYAALFGSGVRLYDYKAIHFSWLGPELLVCSLAHRVSTGLFLLLRS